VLTNEGFEDGTLDETVAVGEHPGVWYSGSTCGGTVYGAVSDSVHDGSYSLGIYPIGWDPKDSDCGSAAASEGCGVGLYFDPSSYLAAGATSCTVRGYVNTSELSDVDNAVAHHIQVIVTVETSRISFIR